MNNSHLLKKRNKSNTYSALNNIYDIYMRIHAFYLRNKKKNIYIYVYISSRAHTYIYMCWTQLIFKLFKNIINMLDFKILLLLFFC